MGAAPASGGLCGVLLKKQTTHSRAVSHPSYELRLARRYINMFSYRYGWKLSLFR